MTTYLAPWISGGLNIFKKIALRMQSFEEPFSDCEKPQTFIKLYY